MFQTVKAKFSLATAALLLLGGGLFMGGSHPAAAQVSSATPTVTETCANQDTAAIAQPTAEPTQAAESDSVDVQCGDQNGPDTANSPDMESTMEPTPSATEQAGDNVDQQGEHQDAGDNDQPDTASNSQ